MSYQHKVQELAQACRAVQELKDQLREAEVRRENAIEDLRAYYADNELDRI